MRNRTLIALGVWAAMAAGAAAQVPGLKLGEPVAATGAPDPKPLAEPDLPPRPARLRYAAADRERRVTEATLAQARGPSRERPPPKMAELFDYLSDRQKGGPDARPVGLGDPDPDRDSGRDPERKSGPLTRLVGNSGGWFTGERMGRLFKKGDNGLFCSDHDFDQFTSPISSPFTFEDPRSLTEVRGLFLYQNIPGGQSNFLGGDAYFGGLQARLALTERLSLSVTKLGVVGVDPQANFRNGTGLAELWLAPKYTFYRDPDAGRLIAGGVQFQIPLGAAKAFQDTGSLSVVPYLSAGQNFLKTRFGSVNALANAGYAFSVNNQRSDYLYASGHLSIDVLNRQKFFPIAEINWVQVTTNGRSRAISGEGRDLFNFGGQAKGSQLLTAAAGLRWRVTKSIELGGAYEFPLVGNRDFFENRFLVDLTLRY